METDWETDWRLVIFTSLHHLTKKQPIAFTQTRKKHTQMACLVNCSNPVRALGIVDALHAIAAYAMEEDEVVLGDDFYLRPYAVVEMTRTVKKPADPLPCPFEQELLLFRSYKVRTPHHKAVNVLKKMGISGVFLMENCEQVVVKGKWRGRATPKKKLFSHACDGETDDDGYLKALEAMSGPAPADWAAQRVKARDEILERFDERLKALSRV